MKKPGWRQSDKHNWSEGLLYDPYPRHKNQYAKLL